jgi:hypothetical protein
VSLLIVCAAATWFMAGLHWFVQVVHYPLFAAVGDEAFPGYHERHSARTTPVVLPVMTVELATSAWLVAAPPDGTSGALLVAGLLLAVATWAATLLVVVPRHRRLGDGPDPAVVADLVRVSWLRTAAWTVHGVVAGLLLAQAA